MRDKVHLSPSSLRQSIKCDGMPLALNALKIKACFMCSNVVFTSSEAMQAVVWIPICGGGAQMQSIWRFIYSAMAFFLNPTVISVGFKCTSSSCNKTLWNKFCPAADLPTRLMRARSMTPLCFGIPTYCKRSHDLGLRILRSMKQL